MLVLHPKTFAFPLPVARHSGSRMTTRELREICQKGSSEPFVISKYLYRPFTIHFSRVYILCGARSNTVTFHSLVAGLIAAGFAISTQTWALLAVAFFVQLYFVLDHVDGEVARYNLRVGKQTPSLAGEFFDLWVHLHTYNIVFALMGLGMFRETGCVVWPILGVIACNISGSYQRLTLASVLVGALARGRVAVDDPRYAALFGKSHGDTSEASPSAATRFFRLGAELVLFPGNLVGISVACLADFVLGMIGGAPWFFRALYLAAYCAAGLASKIFRTRQTIRELANAASPTPSDP
jgi:phosphatidylglycerophosphate synthase